MSWVAFHSSLVHSPSCTFFPTLLQCSLGLEKRWLTSMFHLGLNTQSLILTLTHDESAKKAAHSKRSFSGQAESIQDFPYTRSLVSFPWTTEWVVWMSCVGLNIYYQYLEQPCTFALIFHYEQQVLLSLRIAFIYENKHKYLEGSLVLCQLNQMLIVPDRSKMSSAMGS